ncbi:hypothetical protein ACEWY4_019118 [Coilia grayii]|uniref:DUF4806 domain-containing protein n=1 Tax=Coilia grayii TaxID=363190 RepID=A0ABD1JF53_9TELE
MLAKSSTGSREPRLPDDVLLPLQNYEDLNSLEQKLANSHYQKDLTAYLGTIGGSSVQGTTRRVLATLIGHSLAMAINWNGSNNKKAFRDLALKRVVVGKFIIA